MRVGRYDDPCTRILAIKGDLIDKDEETKYLKTLMDFCLKNSERVILERDSSSESEEESSVIMIGKRKEKQNQKEIKQYFEKPKNGGKKDQSKKGKKK